MVGFTDPESGGNVALAENQIAKRFDEDFVESVTGRVSPTFGSGSVETPLDGDLMPDYSSNTSTVASQSGSLSSTYGGDKPRGMYFTVNDASVNAVYAQLGTFSGDRAGIAEFDGNGDFVTHATVDVSGFGSGDYIGLLHNFKPGVQYALYVWSSDGSDFTANSDGPAVSLDNSYVTLDYYGYVWYGTEFTQNVLSVFSDMTFRTVPFDTLSATVNFERPEYVVGWDIASYSADEPGDSEVALYIEDDAGDELGGPLAPGEQIPALPSQNANYRFDFTLGSDGNYPRVDEALRRRKM
ncbi:hypothetical protein ACFQJC_14450 [Haloferax namakaokahaiae]|uniref:Uncharacterized protein n=1 Tax=Haloferax namakaokahaiae TaxID=1748331 RepID=A0ABD5ZI55_9EURY